MITLRSRIAAFCSQQLVGCSAAVLIFSGQISQAAQGDEIESKLPIGKTGREVPSEGSVYRASSSFSTNANPSGPWSFGWKPTRGAALTLLTVRKSISNNSDAVFGWGLRDGDGPAVGKSFGPTAVSPEHDPADFSTEGLYIVTDSTLRPPS